MFLRPSGSNSRPIVVVTPHTATQSFATTLEMIPVHPKTRIGIYRRLEEILQEREHSNPRTKYVIKEDGHLGRELY